MKRWALRIGVCLFLGVITTVGVAWWILRFADLEYDSTVRTPRDELFQVFDPHEEGHYGWFMDFHGSARGIEAEELFASRRDSEVIDFHLTYRTGWPMPALTGTTHSSVGHGRRGSLIGQFDPEFLPPDPPRELFALLPIFPGFLINTLFYAAIWFGIFFGIGTARRAIRKKRGRCLKCGYDLRGGSLPSPPGRGAGGEGSSTAGCPECGWGRGE